MTSSLIPGIPDEEARRIIELVRQVAGVEEIILFGSRAKGSHREGSDIDLAIKGASISEEGLKDFQWKYEELYLPWKVDLIVYSSIQVKELREHIDRVGLLLG